MDWQHECEIELIKTYLNMEPDGTVGTWEGNPIENFSRTALLGMIIEIGRMHRRQSAQWERDLDFLRDCGEARRKLGG
jgi:hypothetical protein